MPSLSFSVVPDENYVDDGNFTYVTGRIATFHADEKNGTFYVEGHYGVFRLNFAVTPVKEITIIIEQNIDSVPEFSSWSILPLFLVLPLVAAVVRKRLSNILKGRCN